MEPEEKPFPDAAEAVHTEPAQAAETGTQPADGEPALFQSWEHPNYVLSPRVPLHSERTPNFGHFCILLLILLVGWICVGVLARISLHYHLFGVQNTSQMESHPQMLLAIQAVLYLLTLAGCVLFFPLVWQKPFLAGIHWNARIAFRFRLRLLAAAGLCFVLAMLNGILLPGPTNAPIDKIIKAPGVAWLMFVFGTTFAPLFEEIGFRGFLLPMFCTAIDWLREMAYGHLPLRNCHNGHPRWTLPAMIGSSILTSVPFALIHGDQTGWSLGPFLLLISVSLVLCWIRLSTRSLAASVVVHALYNFLLFVLMMIGTGGFQHLDKM